MPAPGEIAPEPPPKNLPDGWRPMWETRSPRGVSFGDSSQKRVWMREVRTLFDGEPLTPFQRLALSCDYTNPLANSGTAGLGFINVDITLYVHRLPVSEWIGYEVEDHGSSEGVCVGASRLYDERGPVGHSLVAGLAQRRRIG
jgi:acyl-CoA thioesterase